MNAAETIGYVETVDSVICFIKVGARDGMPLFVLNGGPGFDHSYLRTCTVWADLGGSRPIIFYDQRGTGKSSEVGKDEACTLAQQLSDLEALREHLGYEQVDVLGHSWGGFLSMAYTARYPARVRRMILVDSAAPRLNDTVFLFKDVFPETVKRREALAFAVEFEDEEAIQADIEEYFSMLFYSPEKKDAWLAQADTRGYRYHVNQKIWSDAQRFDLNPELGKISQPTLVITGRFDINVAPSVAYGIHKAIPGSRFKAFEQSGHLPFIEEPEAFRQVVEDFLSES
jgi:proline iminopeptidase